MQITYNGQTYNAEDKRDLVYKLRYEGRLHYRQIGELVGLSKGRIGQILGKTGRVGYPELRKLETFRDSDEVIALRLGVPLSRVVAARQRLNIRLSFRVDIYTRRKRLVNYLFGPQYLPGPNLSTFIRDQIKKLSPRRQQVLEEFYVTGTAMSLSDNINFDSERIYRSLAKKMLKEIVAKFEPKELIEQGIIDD